MNRLWVRISLVMVIIVVLIGSLPLIWSVPERFRPEFDRHPPTDQPGEDPVQPVPRMPQTEEELEEIKQEFEIQFYLNFAQRILISAGVAVILGVLLSRSLASPLKQMEDGAKEISSGNLAVRVEEQGAYEFRALANSFNQMAADLERQESLRSNLLADVTHELRHPAHILQGNIRAILDGVYPLNEEEISKLYDQTELLTTLVNDLHLMAQAEAGKLILNFGDSDLSQAVKSVVDVFRSLAENIGVQIDFKPVETGMVYMDKDRIRQVIQNLLTNAIEFSNQGNTITVEMEQLSSYIEIRVIDQGEGLDPAKIPMIFDRFFRADTSRNRNRPGSGLGLSISKAIVESHGGYIKAHSEGPGTGMSITVGLPVRA